MVGTYKSGFLPGLSTPTLCPFFRIDLYRLFVEHGASCLVRCTKQLTQSYSLNFIMIVPTAVQFFKYIVRENRSFHSFFNF